MTELTVTDLEKSFGTKRALDRVSFTAEDGKLLTLLGPSGCGKSTTLWAVAGLHQPDGGQIRIGDDLVYDSSRRLVVPPERRECGVVFQSYAVWPHFDVHDNVAYPLRLRRVGKAEQRRRVAEVLELVELDHLGSRYPHQLSGGQQQRVALARALAHPPRLLLLDEPFSNLDAKLRERARTWLRELQERLGITTIFVTHDQDEALSMSDRIIVMNDGRIAQEGTPEEIYRQPADVFVADFIGRINLLPARVQQVSDGLADVVIDGTSTVLTIGVPRGTTTGPVHVGIRPEAIGLDTGDVVDRSAAAVVGTSVGRRFVGDHYRHIVDIGGTEVVVQTAEPKLPDHPRLVFRHDACTVFPTS
ncbi:ABC transporter ATP-binding protein [Desertimonas flava]|uniref:ABC transporter ATP-binding protein n=1 Tax=Desertimonas flava TaxID=2064846 RepID=UPI000E357E61|nr:ABC transporter ATP-binding protein [Desertimonas flava]